MIREIDEAYQVCSESEFVSYCLGDANRRGKVLPDLEEGRTFITFSNFARNSIGILVGVNDQDKNTLPDRIIDAIKARIPSRFPQTLYPGLRPDRYSALFLMSLAILRYLTDRNRATLGIMLRGD